MSRNKTDAEHLFFLRALCVFFFFIRISLSKRCLLLCQCRKDM